MRKQKDKHYIYKTTCNVTGRYYIGMHSTSNIDDGYIGSGLRLRRSIRKYGIENHIREILEYVDTRERLVEREKELITSDMIQDINCMNLKNGGEGGFISEEQQRYRSQCGGNANTIKLRTDNEYYLSFIERVSKKIIESNRLGKMKNSPRFTGKEHSKETKILMSNKAMERLGEKNSQFGTMWITNGVKNKKIKKESLDDWLVTGWLKGRK